MKVSPFIFAIATSAIVLVNVLFFVRKFILKQHGYGFSPIDATFQDWKRLNRVIDSTEENSEKRKLILINLSIPALFCLAVLFMIFAVVLMENGH